MKRITTWLVFILCCGVLAACSAQKQTQQEGRYARKIYLTEQDYLDDLGEEAAKERRETQPLVESEYIFNAVPETEKAVYFFDDRQQPKVPGDPNDADYKREKRLWQKPKRYTPEQYYGMQGSSEQSSSSSYDY